MVLRSGIRKKTYSGFRIQWVKRHRIPDPGYGSATQVVPVFDGCDDVAIAAIGDNGFGSCGDGDGSKIFPKKVWYLIVVDPNPRNIYGSGALRLDSSLSQIHLIFLFRVLLLSPRFHGFVPPQKPVILPTSVADPRHFGVDPDPLIHASD
jgi:hypothetical protein